MNIGIYQIKNIKTGKVYFGSSENLKKRLRDHKRELLSGIHDNDKLQNSWRKHGQESFLFEVILYCEEIDLISNEQMFIDNFPEEKMYNICLTAGNTKGYKHSEESKRKIGDASRGNSYGSKRVWSLEDREKQRQIMLKRPPLSEESRKKISVAKKGIKNSPEHTANIAKALKGKPLSEKAIINSHKPEALEKSRQKKKGKHLSGEHKEKLSKIRNSPAFKENFRKKMKGRKVSEETRVNMSNAQRALAEKNKLEGKVKTNSESTRQKIKDRLNSPETKALLKQRWVERKQKQQNTENK